MLMKKYRRAKNRVFARLRLLRRLRSRGVHGNREDWDPMGPMGFPWEWE